MVVSSSGKKGLRSFTVIDARHVDSCKTKFLVRGDSGRYLNRNPASAAKKAFRQLCGLKKIRGQCAMFISMRETTQNSSDRVFTYKLNRRKLPEPVVVVGIKREYETRIKSIKKMPDNCKKSRKTSGPMKAKKKKSKTLMKFRMNNNKNKNNKTKKRKH